MNAADEALGLVYEALRRYKSPKIDDVTRDDGNEIVLTTDDGAKRRAWVVALQEVEVLP